MSDTATREPKRRNSAATRARILGAASDVFLELGYAKTGLRDIALKADVASSLLIRYFGTKAALFEAALANTIAENTVFTLEKTGFGERMAEMIVARSSIRITAMLILALADAESRDAARRISNSHVIAPLADWLGPPHALSRALSMFSLMTGFVVQMEAVGPGAVQPRAVAWLARSLQSIVDEH